MLKEGALSTTQPIAEFDDAVANEAPPVRIKRWLPALAPSILGLAFGRAGIITSTYSSYRLTDNGIFTDGSMIVSLVVMLVPFFIITATKAVLPKTWVNRIARVCIVIEALCLLALGMVDASGNTGFGLHFALSVASTLSASGAMFYWLRRLRGTGTVITVTFVFLALGASEIELLACAFLPPLAGSLLAGALVLVQLPCMRWARGKVLPSTREQLMAAKAFPGFNETTLKSRLLLVAMAVSIGLLAIVTGFLRGYPDGNPIPLSPACRIGYAVLVIAMCLVTIALACGRGQRIMPASFFVILEFIACLAIFCYALFPDALDIGGAFTTTLNALMVGLAWYIIVAFMSYGWRDPYYYAFAGWFVWLGARSAVRTATIVAPLPFEGGNPALMLVIAGCLVTLSAQATFGMFLFIEQKTVAELEAEAKREPNAVMRIMGLDKEKAPSDARERSVRESAAIMGKQFLLSEREVEVLALYAQGFTQKKVAEQLFIAQSTAHEHIKRIYAKTGLHSRQEIIDYIAQYAS